jgi:hypothetical protein
VEPVGNTTLYTTLQFLLATISLIRSETLPHPIKPLAPCDLYYSNFGTGGRITTTTCYKSTGNQTGAHFLGQFDTSAVLIITDVLGDGSKNTSDQALNQTGLDWFIRNEKKIDDLLVSRGILLGGDRSTVFVSETHTEAAISYLQVLLVVLPAVLAIASWGFTALKPMSYYGCSFLAAVSSTTHIDRNERAESCEKPGYLKKAPSISLKHSRGHVVLETPNGILTVQEETAEKQNEKEPLVETERRRSIYAE